MATNLPECLRVSLSGTFDGRPWVNVLHFLNAGAAPWTNADIDAHLALLGGAAASAKAWQSIHQTMDTNSNFSLIVGRTLSNGAPIERQLVVNINGTSSGNNMPPMTAVLLKWTTAIASRKYRGRTYLPGLNVGFLAAGDSDRVDATVSSNLQTRATAFANAWSFTSEPKFIVLSQSDRAANLAAPYYQVLSGAPYPLVAVQRRRRG